MNYCLSVLFFSFAILQYNDSDFYIWIPIYLSVSVLCFLAARKKFYPRTYYVVTAIYFLYAVWKFLQTDGVLSWELEHEGENLAQSMEAKKPWIENTREFFGLVISIFSILLNLAWYYANKNTRTTHSN